MTGQYAFRHLLNVGCVITCSVVMFGQATAAERPDISDNLNNGRLLAAQESLNKYLTEQPADDLARFQLGVVQFLGAVEGLAQDSYRYGLNPGLRMVPFLRTPIEANSHPEGITYDDVRAMIERFVSAIDQAEKTLTSVKDRQLFWKLDLVAVRLDMNGDGQAQPDETLWSVFEHFASAGRRDTRPGSFTVGLDSADVHWLRGYCHLVAALGEAILAFDHHRLFDHTAQLFFADPRTSYASILGRDGMPRQDPWNRDEIFDMIAFVHLANFPLREPERLANARRHLLAMIDASRKSWELIDAETDNDREWIPGPNQTSIVEGITMSNARVAAWRRFLDEAAAVLQGKKLIPFWRGNSAQGVNLMKAFTEPRDFDLVLWVQGTAAWPYLEQGESTSPETWAEFQRVFGGRFIGFAIWIN